MDYPLHLRSTREVASYHLHATDGEIGHVEDFIVDDENWAIRFLVVDTSNWLPGKKVLLSTQLIKRVEWADSSVHFDVTRESVKNSPEFDPSNAINRVINVPIPILTHPKHNEAMENRNSKVHKTGK